MKNKLLLTFLAIVCVVCCVCALAACGGGDKVTCTLEPTPAHVNEVRIGTGESIDAVLGASRDVWSVSDKIEKGKEYDVQVDVGDYDLGTLKMFINGTEIPLAKHPRAMNLYVGKYTPTGDFTITFSGALSLAINVSGVDVDPSEIEMKVGSQEILDITVDAGGTPITDVNLTVVSNNTSVATVTLVQQEGASALYRVTAVNAGEATITVSAGGKTATCHVVVISAPVANNQVTADQWRAALSKAAFTNFTATYKQTGLNTDLVLKADLANNKYFYNDSDNGETYYSKENGNYYRYQKRATDNKFVRFEVAQEEYENKIFDSELMTGLQFSEAYSLFSYIQESKTYFAPRMEVDGNAYAVEAKFENGKLVYVKVDLGNNANIVITYVYGATTVTLPGNYVENSNEVDEAQWREALSMSSFSNCTSTMTYTGIPMSFVLKADLANYKYYFNNNDGAEIYYSREAGNYYCYEKRANADTFTREKVTQDRYDNHILYLEQMAALQFSERYYDFEYNQEKGTYFAPELLVGESATYAVEAKFENGKLVESIIDLGGGELLTVKYVYGATTVTLPANYVEKGVETEIDKGRWSDSLSNVDNCAITIKSNDVVETTVKIDDYKYYFTSSTEEYILAQAKSSFYKYVKNGDSWERCAMANDNYLDEVALCRDYFELKYIIGEQYEAFTYSDGKYTAAEVGDKYMDVPLKNVEVTFADGAVVSIKFDVDGKAVVFGGINTSTVELPVNFTVGQGLRYVLNSDNQSYSVYGMGNETGANVVIPSQYKGLPVTVIGESAFSDCSDLTSIVIPDSVTSIGPAAFSSCSGLTSIEIPSSVTTIGNNAFLYCSGFTSIEIPYGVVSIEYNAFCNCSELTSVTISDSVTNIGYEAFKGCSKLTSLTLGNGVTSIGSSAFGGCNKLTSLVIPNSVTSISNNAFNGCEGLTSISLPFVCNTLRDIFGSVPSSLTTVAITGGSIIDDFAFSYCSGLTSVTIADSIKSIGYQAFYECSGLTSVTIGSGVTSIGNRAFYNCSNLTSIVVPNSVTLMGDEAFAGCDGLTSITLPFVGKTLEGADNYSDSHFGYIFNGIPSSLKTVVITNVAEIRSGAFMNCSNLTSIVIPDDVTSIGGTAFYGCSGLTSIAIPSSVTSIGGSAFEGCSGLTSVTLPNGLTNLGISAFKDCTGLTSIELPNGVTIVNVDAFSGCTDLVSVTLLGNVTAIGESAFENCSSLASITIPDSVKTIGSDAFRNTPWYDNKSDGVVYVGKVAYKYKGDAPVNTNVVLNAGTEIIANDAFNGCSWLTSIEIPDSVTSIGKYAFNSCSALTSVEIPNSVTSIGADAFRGCSQLTSVTLGNGITSIADRAFANCNNLESIVIPDGVTSIGYGAFDDCYGLENITIPDSVTAIGAYAFSSTHWFNAQPDDEMVYAGKVAYKFKGRMIEEETVTLAEGTKGIAGEAFSDCNWLTSIEILSSITNIGDNAFRNCTGLTSIVIPDTVLSIGAAAFDGCSGLTSITLPFVGNTLDGEDNATLGYIFDGVPSSLKTVVVTGGTTIGNGAFQYGYGLTSITLPDSVTSIGNAAFMNCRSLTSIALPSNLTSIGINAFLGCSGLTSITIPDGVTVLGARAFEGCSELASIVLSGNVTSIGDYAFSGCSSLTSITIPDGVTAIGERAFEACIGLTSLVIPNNVTSIGAAAFEGCDGLTGINLPFVGNTLDGTDNATLNYVFGGVASSLETVVITGGSSIGAEAFKNYSNLTSIVIPSSVTSIGASAFEGCSGLTSIVIPNAVTELNERVFKDCSGLTSIEIPNGVTSIGASAFSGCSGITSIEIPNGVTSIGASAFSGCSGIASIVVPDSVTIINRYAFRGCDGLTSITLPFVGKTLDGAGNITLGYIFDDVPSSLTTVVITGGIMITYGAFQYCSGLTSITIPDSVTTIEGKAFQNCSGLTSIALPDGLTSIGANAFEECSNLTGIVIPNSVTSIGHEAFANCSMLKNLTLTNGSISMQWRTFDNCPIENATVAVEILREFDRSNLKELTIVGNGSIDVDMLARCGQLESITVDGNENHASQDGILYNKAKTEIVYIPRFVKGAVSIPDGVTTIGNISGLSALTSLVIPASVTQIGDIADCDNLATVTFPAGLDVSHITFDNCPKYKGQLSGDFYIRDNKLMGVREDAVMVIIPSTVTAIAANAFQGVSGLKYIYVPSTIETYESGAFAGCENVQVFFESSNIPGSLSTIKRYYYHVGSITEDGWIYRSTNDGIEIVFYVGVGGEVNVPAQIGGENVTLITSYSVGGDLYGAFLWRDDITKITISASLSTVGNTFEYLSNLTEIALSENVSQFTIYKTALTGCDKLTAISLAGGYDNYLMYKMQAVQGATPTIINITDAEDLYTKVKSSGTNEVCVIAAKGQE